MNTTTETETDEITAWLINPDEYGFADEGYNAYLDEIAENADAEYHGEFADWVQLGQTDPRTPAEYAEGVEFLTHDQWTRWAR